MPSLEAAGAEVRPVKLYAALPANRRVPTLDATGAGVDTGAGVAAADVDAADAVSGAAVPTGAADSDMIKKRMLGKQE